MNTLIAYATLTGNTKKVAQSIYDIVKDNKQIICLNENKNIDTNNFDTIIIGYWVDKGHMDNVSKKFLKNLKNKNIALFGTLGADPNSDHGKNVQAKVNKLCSENNNCIGSFLCQGKVDPKLVEKMGKFPLNLVHPLTPERLARIEEASKHPNHDDLEKAQKYFLQILD